MNGHGYVLLPSRQGGAVLGDLDVSPCAAWTGHSPLCGQASWVNPAWRLFRRVSGVSAKGGQVHFIDWLLTWW